MANIHNSLSELANREDFTWATYDIFAWVTAELFLIIVCGSIPTLKPLLNFLRRLAGYTSKYSGNSYTRHTGDSGGNAIELNGFRTDGAKSKAAVSSMPHVSSHEQNARDDVTPMKRDDIRVDKTYKVRVERSESEEELNQRGLTTRG